MKTFNRSSNKSVEELYGLERQGMLSTVSTVTDDLEKIMSEIKKGLPSQMGRMELAKKNNDFYDGKVTEYMRYKDAESVWDHDQKPQLDTKLTRQCIDTLAKHLYNPGPNRNIEADDEADAWLQEIYRTNNVNALFHEADKLCTLNRVAMLKIAATGNESSEDPNVGEATGDAPLIIHLYGSEEFAIWTSPDQPTKPWAVCTVTTYDEYKEYELWTKDQILVFRSELTGTMQTTGSKSAQFIEEKSGDNPYGVLPFVFINYSVPVRDFWVSSPGDSIVRTNEYMNNQICDLANAVSLYCCPMLMAYNVLSTWKPVVRPGGASHVPGMPNQQQTGLEPRLEFMSGQIDIQGQWQHLDNVRNECYEDNNIPLSEVRMGNSSPVSGVAIIGEQAPLLTRAKARRLIFTVYEIELARVCLVVAGTYYENDRLYQTSLDPKLALTWAEPEIPIPGPDKDQADEWELQNGFTSEIRLYAKRQGITNDQARKELEEMAEERAWFAQIKQDYMPQMPQPDQQGMLPAPAQPIQ